MNKKVLTLSAVMASMLFGAAAHAADRRAGGVSAGNLCPAAQGLGDAA